jgi:NAD kinase
MCHGYTPRDWSSEVAEEFAEELEEAETDDPSFVENEPAEDIEILTDGGDGTPQSASADEDE